MARESPFLSISGMMEPETLLIKLLSWILLIDSSSLPDSIFERSRISFINCRRFFPFLSIISIYSFCFSLIRPAIPSAMRFVRPSMEFKGVRSSCDIFDKNSDLSRVASSTRSDFSSISFFWDISSSFWARISSLWA